ETNIDASALSFRISDGSNVVDSPSLDIDIDSWMYVIGVVDRASDFIRIFKNGLQVDSGNSIGGIGNISNNLPLLAPTSSYDLDGLLDEIRICNRQRSAGWIATEYENQNNPGSFYTLSTELVIDMIAPTYSNLIENSDPLELGETEVIQINVSDPSGILEVKIEFEGLNHSMTNIGGDIWQYDSWTPNIVGNYSFIIYMYDNLDNWNSTIGSIEVIDNTPPNYSNLIESSDPLELGETEVIQINVNDFAGVSQVKIEFEGLNHSMTNIGGNTWQYDSWTPDNWIVYQYKFHMEDNNGNWKVIVNNITVVDTITPSPPILTNAPSGDISGNVVFDWSDGTDPSSIFCYILIIDNESDPSMTPGYIYKFNITNTGPESSYYELNDTLPSGKYYYFLTQVDGAGHESSYTMGTFTFNLNSINNDLPIFLIIAVILISVASSITAITIVRKKSHKKISPPRKKVPLKLILAHIAKLSIQEPTTYEKEHIQSYSEKIFDKADLGINIDEIKSLGEELFEEGAYLEAIKQFQNAKEILSKQGKKEDLALFSDLIAGIEGLIEEREKRIEYLEKEKIDGDSVKIFELYFDIIEISKKLRDLDAINMYQSELYQFFQPKKFKLVEIENHRFEFEKKADSLSNNGFFEMAAQIYGKCEEISQFLVKLESEEEIANVEKFRNKKNENLEKIS
ncbi:MAG: LamG-like jellyroll fold domain-containing protein, partial [Promethearchaeota archaeon]